MGIKLSNAPVYYTVVQVQFNPILNLESYLPAIQPKMRGAHFPDFRSEVFQRLVLPFAGMEAGQIPTPPTLTPQPRYTFGDIGGRSNFVLESNTLAFQTTAYETFETFSAQFLQGLTTLHDAIQLDFIERIGLRYFDAVMPINHGESLRDYLIPEVLGMSGRLQGKMQHTVSETLSLVGLSQLVTRVVIRDGHVSLPMELAQSAPTVDPRFTQMDSRQHAVIDNDASITQREIFDLAMIQERLTFLHEEIKTSFGDTVTDHARSIWA